MKIKVNIKSALALFLRLLTLTIFFLFQELYPKVDLITYFMCIYLLVELVFINRFNYISPNFGFNASWLLIFFFSIFEYSSYFRPLNLSTVMIVSTAIIIFNVFCSLSIKLQRGDNSNYSYSNRKLQIVKLFFIVFVILNIAIAGYVPLIKLITSGDSGYLDFGLPGLYGLFLAFSNALGVLSFYLYLKTGSKKHLYFFLFIILIFIVFMTRQNIISLVIESFFVYTVLKGRIQIAKASIIAVISIVVFGALGSLRSGSIDDLIGVKPEYSWIPSSFTWVYSYFYFNILNLDNVINYSAAPYYDRSSLTGFLPSFLRGENTQDYDSTLELINFNIASYMYPLYADMGRYWLYTFTGMAAFVTKIYFDKLNYRKDFPLIASCSVLYFCALMSFFVNFWAYLPIISQLIFIPLLWRFVRR